MDGGKAAETHEICRVQGQDMGHTVDIHRCREAGVVHLNTQHSVLDDDSPPLPIDSFAIRQQGHSCFYQTHFTFCFGEGQPKTVASDRASHHVPKLGDVLVGVVQNRALSLKTGKSCIDELVVRVGASGDAQEDIRVDQTPRDCPLVVVLVNPLT
jgi:hypothetical protein